MAQDKVIYLLIYDGKYNVYFDEYSARRQATIVARQGENPTLRKVELTDSQIMPATDPINLLYPILSNTLGYIPFAFQFRYKPNRIKDGLSVNIPIPAYATENEIQVVKIVAEHKIKKFHNEHPEITVKLNLNGKLHLCLAKE